MTIESSGADRLPALDTVRAVGALAVLTTHAGFHSGLYGQGVPGRLVARMDVGVAIFFVLSGFLLARPWLVAARDGTAGPDARTYLRKRFWRIYPAYAVVAVVVLLLQPRGAEGERGLGAWLSTLTMSGIYTSERLPWGFTQTWSLTTEVTFYLALPLLARLVIGRGALDPRRVLLVLVSLAAVNVVWLLWLSTVVATVSGRVTEWLPAYLTWFAGGIALALVHVAPERTPRATRVLRSWGALPGSCLVAVLGLLLVAGTPLAGPSLLEPATPGEGLWKNLVYAAVGCLLLVPVVWARPGSRFVRALSHPVPRHLGHISYSVFLVHMLVIELVMDVTGYPLFGGHFWQIYLLALVVSIAVAELLYRFVERPVLEATVRRSRRTSTPSATTPTTTS